VATPHHTTIRQWIIRNGCYELEKHIPEDGEWTVLADITIDVGKKKCLALLGLNEKTLENRRDYKLTHKDVKVLGLYPTD